MKFNSDKGLSLIELLATLAIISMVATISAGSFTWLIERSSASTTRSNIEQTFSLARYIAVTEQTIVTICPLDSAQKCTNNWSLPTAVFRDPTNTLELMNSELHVKSVTLPAGGSLTPSNSFNGPRKHFQYGPDGSVRGTIGNFTWCPKSGNAKSAIHVRINFGGRLTWSQDSDGNDIVETANRTDVSC